MIYRYSYKIFEEGVMKVSVEAKLVVTDIEHTSRTIHEMEKENIRDFDKRKLKLEIYDFVVIDGE